jgi:hypothetical protein
MPVLYSPRYRQIPPIIQILRVHPLEAQAALLHTLYTDSEAVGVEHHDDDVDGSVPEPVQLCFAETW